MVSIFYLQLIKLEIISKYKFAAKSKHIQNQQKLTNYRLTSEWSMKSARDKLNQRSPQTSVNNSAYKSGKLWYKSYVLGSKLQKNAKYYKPTAKQTYYVQKVNISFLICFTKTKVDMKKIEGVVSQFQKSSDSKKQRSLNIHIHNNFYFVNKNTSLISSTKDYQKVQGRAIQKFKHEISPLLNKIVKYLNLKEHKSPYKSPSTSSKSEADFSLTYPLNWEFAH